MLIPNFGLIEIDFILSNHITLRDVDVYYSTTLGGLRFLIGRTTEVNLCDISIVNGGPTQLGQGGQMDISQSTNVVISKLVDKPLLLKADHPLLITSASLCILNSVTHMYAHALFQEPPCIIMFLIHRHPQKMLRETSSELL